MSLHLFLVGRSMKLTCMKHPGPLLGESRTCLLQGIALGAVVTATVGFMGRLGHERARSES